MTKYFTIGQDKDFTTHVFFVSASGEVRIVATLNSWWKATRFAAAMNSSIRGKVSDVTIRHERSEANTIMADGIIRYTRAVRDDINRYTSGPHPTLAENPHAIY